MTTRTPTWSPEVEGWELYHAQLNTWSIRVCTLFPECRSWWGRGLCLTERSVNFSSSRGDASEMYRTLYLHRPVAHSPLISPTEAPTRSQRLNCPRQSRHPVHVALYQIWRCVYEASLFLVFWKVHIILSCFF